MPDNAIWAVTGPEHDARMARELAWIATGGQTGIVGPWSCEVVAQPTPNGTVRIMPGGFSIAATSQFAAIGYTSAPWQAYMRSLYEPLTVDIDPTGSSGGRTDVVGIVVDDPEFEGTSPDPDTHQYWRPHVVRNAGNNATRPEHFASLGRPFLPLAQVRIPSSTATITNSMIHDLRFLAVARSVSQELIAPANPSGGNITIPPSASGWQDITTFSNIQVPQWATRAQVSMGITHAYGQGGAVGGAFRIALTGSSATVTSGSMNFVEQDSFERFQLHAAGDLSLSRATAGGSVTVRLQVQRLGDRPGTIVIPDASTHTSTAFGRIVFDEAPRSTAS